MVGGGGGRVVKKEIEHLVQVIPNDNEDSIWIQINKGLINEKDDIYIGTYYVSPYNMNNKHAFLHDV